MMATVNDRLSDESVAHAINLQQYAVGVARRMVATLNRSDARIMAELAIALDQLEPESFTVQRLEALLVSVRSLNAEIYREVFGLLETELRALAEFEAGYQLDLFRGVIPEPVQVRFPLAPVAPQQAFAAAMARPFQGRLLREWAATVEADRMAKVRNAVRQGFVEGKTASQIVREIRGTRAANYADGFLQRPRRELMTVVQTAVSHTAATARQAFQDANSDIIKAVVWVSTLDSKTSEPCRIRDQLRYEAKTHKPIGHKIPWLAGPGRLHFNCRSTDAPVTKSWRELGIPIDEMTPAQRASMDGQVPAEMTYAEWLKRQSAGRQDQILGPERGRLMREGGLQLPDFYDSRGNWLNLDELKRREAEAFRAMAA